MLSAADFGLVHLAPPTNEELIQVVTCFVDACASDDESGYTASAAETTEADGCLKAVFRNNTAWFWIMEWKHPDENVKLTRTHLNANLWTVQTMLIAPLLDVYPH